MTPTSPVSRIAIVGAGQAALCLAVSLQRTPGYHVTLVTDRTADEIRQGPIVASQILFGPALDGEKAAGVQTWSQEAPAIQDLDLRYLPGAEGAEPAAVRAPLEFSARSVDLRLKMPTWLEQLESLGATILYKRTSVEDLESIAAQNDLVVVASGKGLLGELFELDPVRSRSAHHAGRELAVALVRPVHREPVSAMTVEIIEDVGELFRYPMLTATGVCEVVMLQGVSTLPGDDHADKDSTEPSTEPSPQFSAEPSPQLSEAGGSLGIDLHRLRTQGDPDVPRILELVGRYFPGHEEQLRGAQAWDDGSFTVGRVRGRVNRPVGTLPSGATVLGLGTGVIITEPLFSAPANNAALAAAYYHTAITRHGAECFDDEWKRSTFETFWRGWAQWTVEWVDDLSAGLGQTQQRLIGAGSRLPLVAQSIAQMVEDPRAAHRWWYEENAAAELIARGESERRANLNTRELRTAFGRFGTGVTIVTTVSPDGVDMGVTANSFTSVSLDPPLVLWCPQLTSTSLPAFEAHDYFCINVLAEDQLPISRQFAVSGSTEKFSGVSLERGIGGVPVLTGSSATFECRVLHRYDAGDHRIYVGEVENFKHTDKDVLGFLGGRYASFATLV